MRAGDPYFDWLCMQVGAKGAHSGYTELLSCLHEKNFIARMEMDSNRGGDGLQLRVDFQNEHGPWGSSVNRGPCTYLEFLIGLGRRMSFLTYGEGSNYTEFYFWQLIRNLELDRCADAKWHDMHGDIFVEDAVYRVNERLYNRDGTGGLFPLKGRGYRDQRYVEIWYQMQSWLMETSSVGEL